MEMKERGEKPKSQLYFLEQICKEKLDTALEDVKRQVQEALKGEIWDVPDYLKEAETELTEGELERFLANHKKQV